MDYTSFANWHLHATFPEALATKKKMLRLISIICFFAFVPLAIKNYMMGYYACSIAMLLFTLVLIVDNLYIAKDKHPPFNVLTVVIFADVAILLSLLQVGTDVVYWVYPTVAVFIYVLPRKEALIIVGLTIIVTAAISLTQVSIGDSLRIVYSLLFLTAVSSASLVAVKSVHRNLDRQGGDDEHWKNYGQRIFDLITQDAFHLKQRAQVNSALTVIRYQPISAVGLRAKMRTQRILTNTLTKNVRGHDFIFSLEDNEFIILSRFCDNLSTATQAGRLCALLNDAAVGSKSKLSFDVGICNVDDAINTDQWLSKARGGLAGIEALAV